MSAGFPQTEHFGLASQIRRAATSIPLNIAEGAGCGSNPEFQRFLRNALRSAYEVTTASETAQRIGSCSPDGTRALLSEADQNPATIVGLSRNLD